MQWRVSATIVLITAWLVFILVYAFFWAPAYNFNLFQNVVLFIASLIALFGLIAAVWASWGMRFANMGWDRWH